MKNKWLKRIFPLMLAAALTLTMLPETAFAGTGITDEIVTEESDEEESDGIVEEVTTSTTSVTVDEDGNVIDLVTMEATESTDADGNTTVDTDTETSDTDSETNDADTDDSDADADDSDTDSDDSDADADNSDTDPDESDAEETGSYTIYFNGNGDNVTGATSALTVYKSEGGTLPDSGFTCDGYVFTGWNTAADGSGTAYAAGDAVDGSLAEDGGSITLYAQWTKNTCTTTYTYSLVIKVTTTAVSDSNSALKKITVTKPKLTTKTTKTYLSGDVVTSSKTTTYGLTVQCNVRNAGWKKASSNSSGTSYVYTASKASSGSYIQAVRITPSEKLKAAMKTAGLTFVYRAKVKYMGTLGWAKAGYAAGTTGNSCAMKGLTLKVVTTSAAKSYDTDNRYIAATSLKYRTRSTGSSSWSGVKSSATTSGKASSSSTSLGSIAIKISKNSSGFSPSGSIKYSVRTKNSDSSSNWSSWKSNYATAGSKNSSLQAIKIKLTGDMADYYDVYYRVYIPNYGWLGWTSNGSKAGSKGIGLTIQAIQVKLVPKGKTVSSSTDSYIDSISGDTTLDSYLAKIYSKKGTNLKTLFKYVSSYTYKRTSDTPSGSWKTWSIKYAKQMYKNQYGNCYRYAALFCWLARGLGYEAKTVKGYVPSRSKGWAPHGWVEIKKSGTTYLCDPDLAKDYPSLNWYMVTYKKAPLTYKKS